MISNNEPAPDFTLPATSGEMLRLSTWRGAPVLLNFFASNCTWCHSELPRLAEVYRRLKNVNLHILGVAVGEDTPESAARFAREKELDFPIVIDGDGSVKTAYALQRVPTIIVLDANGLAARIYEGASEQLAGIVEQTALAIAGEQPLPDFTLIGNGCAP